VNFTVACTQPAELTLHFRIPAWAQGAQIWVNGIHQKGSTTPGQFAAIKREWKTGDRVELNLPQSMRLEAIDAKHTDTVALMRGPLVLMAVRSEQTKLHPKLTREQLLSAKRMSERQWEVSSEDGPIVLLPFTSIGSHPYSTYLKVI
jgi:DUF1680 family protein